jgi:4-alpha-glucanotransferase
MSDDALMRLAEQAGLHAEWQDVHGTEHRIGPGTLRGTLKALGFAADSESDCRDSTAAIEAEDAAATPLTTADIGEAAEFTGKPGRFRITLESGKVLEGMAEPSAKNQMRLPVIDEAGYHRLETGDADGTLAVAPKHSRAVEDVAEKRNIWGLAVQVYGLRRAGDGGIGDFKALAQFAENAARHGADAVAVSPAHALFTADPSHFGPYAPSSRIALNALYAPVDTNHPASGDRDALIDWVPSAQARLKALRRAFEAGEDAKGFAAFCASSVDGLRNHAIFEMISVRQAKAGASRDWRDWPEDLRNPGNQAVRALAEAEKTEVDFHLYLQYRASQGLRDAQRAAKQAGMKIGLIADLAVGADAAGSDAWGRPDEVLRGLAIGAPPDAFNRDGQNWGVTGFSPRGLRRSGYAAFLDMLRSAMGAAGGLRIDHAMGLARLWVVPQGADAKDGVYLGFPIEDLLRLVSLESQRHGAIVIAEDLGTVPPGFREHLAARKVSGMSVLWFEREEDRFIPPAEWRVDTAAMTTTHDLPTVAGWWTGRDIEWRDKLNIAGEDRDKRAADRIALWDAFRASGAASGTMPEPDKSAPVADAAAAHLGTASSPLAILPVEDALALIEQPNLPGTIDEHPNWRRRLPGEAATLLDDATTAARLSGLNKTRQTP